MILSRTLKVKALCTSQQSQMQGLTKLRPTGIQIVVQELNLVHEVSQSARPNRAYAPS